MEDLVIKTNLVSIWDLGELDEPNENGLTVRKVPNHTHTGPEGFMLILKTYKGTDIFSIGPKRNMSAGISIKAQRRLEPLEQGDIYDED
jgi:hypothetical protein